MNKSITRILGIGLILIASISCSHSHDAESMQHIILNQGKKWKVDENMMSIIRDMETDVSSFKLDESGSYAGLSEGLDVHLKNLTSNCTMTGLAHDELHKWLVPFMGMASDLSEHPEGEAGADSFEKIQDAMGPFNTYFE